VFHIPNHIQDLAKSGAGKFGALMLAATLGTTAAFRLLLA
jgi:hypothetical protein